MGLWDLQSLHRVLIYILHIYTCLVWRFWLFVIVVFCFTHTVALLHQIHQNNMKPAATGVWQMSFYHIILNKYREIMRTIVVCFLKSYLPINLAPGDLNSGQTERAQNKTSRKCNKNIKPPLQLKSAFCSAMHVCFMWLISLFTNAILKCFVFLLNQNNTALPNRHEKMQEWYNSSRYSVHLLQHWMPC